MSKTPDDTPAQVDEAENRSANKSQNDTLGDVINRRFSRREIVGGALAVTAIEAVSGSIDKVIPAARAEGILAEAATFAFDELAVSTSKTHHMAPGYDANVLIRWGDKVLPGAPAFDASKPSAEAQAKQFGYNNDFIGFISLGDDRNRGLLVVNHEYTNDELMYPDFAENKPRKEAVPNMPEALARASMQAHGGSVIEIVRQDGTWSVVENSTYARRITAHTKMRISGPAAGHDLLKTSDDPSGTRVKGMLNNCAGGITPWGTWLTCEENINYYFWNKEAAKASTHSTALSRYGIPEDYYPWARFEPRFDLGREPNECNRFGWVVEIDPKNPESMPVKRTAMGRFKHEGAGSVVNKDGRFVVYQGDDQRFDYVYKFVTEAKVDLEESAANTDILDSGTLYVARFDDDGTGEWLPLVAGHEKLGAFKNQGEILIHTRLTADALGATKMDRPEDIEVSPKTGRVYVMLTKNKKREDEGPLGVNAANPRPANKFGHIIELTPDDGDHAATRFRWEILLKCGDPAVASVGATFNPATSKNGWFGTPDNCVFDAEGRLWIATDGNSKGKTGRADGLWALETDGDRRGTSICFFQCPTGAELCGPCFTPDMETLFVAVQHPGEAQDDAPSATFAKPATRWPDFKDGVPPRPSVLAVTRRGGGKIGA